MDKIEEKRYGLTSIPFQEGIRKQPAYDGVFYKSTMSPNATDAFKRMKNPELDKIKAGNIAATHLGPGASQLSVDTFRLLKQNPQHSNTQDAQIELVKGGLTKKVDDLVKQRQEFQDQIQQHKDQKAFEERQRKEAKVRNNEFWR